MAASLAALVRPCSCPASDKLARGAKGQGASHGCDSTECDCRKAAAKPAETSWLWTLAYGYHEDRTPTHGYEPTREAAMAAFAKSWRKE